MKNWFKSLFKKKKNQSDNEQTDSLSVENEDEGAKGNSSDAKKNWIKSLFKKKENNQSDNEQTDSLGVENEDEGAKGNSSDAKKNWIKSLFKKNKSNQSDNEQTDSLDAQNDTGDSENIEDSADNLKKKKERRPWSKKKKILFISLVTILIALLSVSAYAVSIWMNPLGEWKSAGEQISPPASLSPSKTPNSTGDETEVPEPTIDPYEELLSKADMEFLNDIINIMLIGVDYAEERETWKGKKAYHSDVMIVVSINTKTNEVNMISLPRDTYAHIPGVKGIYKLNASIDCGGGWPKESGFKKVCEAACWMLGGKIPVEYYYAVDMSAVKQLVDSIGGIDFEIEFNYKMQGRSYKKGLQHLDGQAVLDYLRVRHLDNDLKRTGRQRKLLVAIFDKVKSSGDIFRIPEMLDAFNGNFYTNTTLGQTAGLAAFFYKHINSDNIKMHTMVGRPNYNVRIFNWNFLITDQKKRVDLIKKIYGIKVKQYADFTYERACFLWESMQADVIIEKSKPILQKVKEILDADALLPENPTLKPALELAYNAVLIDPLDTDPTESPDPTETDPTETDPPETDPTETDPPETDPPETDPPETDPPETPTPPPTPPPGGWRKYGTEIWNLYNLAAGQYEQLISWSSKYVSKEKTEEYKALNIELKKNIESLCTMFSIKKPDWRVNYEKKTNEKKVDFR